MEKGRPSIGGMVEVRLGHLKAEITRYAEDNNMTRSEAIRKLIQIGLESEEDTYLNKIANEAEAEQGDKPYTPLSELIDKCNKMV